MFIEIVLDINNIIIPPIDDTKNDVFANLFFKSFFNIYGVPSVNADVTILNVKLVAVLLAVALYNVKPSQLIAKLNLLLSACDVVLLGAFHDKVKLVKAIPRETLLQKIKNLK